MTNVPKAVNLRQTWSSFGEINFSLQTTGAGYWKQVNNYPRMGIAAFFGNTGSPEYIGHMAGIFPYVNFALHRDRIFRLGFRLGTGIAWIEKPFNVYTNSKNMMIGSHLNSCISMLAEAEVKLTSHLAASSGISFTHISNGLTETPNLGLNIPALTIGLRYHMTEPATCPKQPLPVFSKRMHWQVLVAGAVKQQEWLESPHFFVPTVSTELMFRQKHGDELGTGLLLTYDASLTREVQNELILSFDNSKSKLQAGLYGCYEHNIGRISIPLQLGIYLYNNYPVKSFFQIIGVRYAVSNHCKALLQLKTHLGKADHIDWGIGYTF
ncbi:MAG TPA: acyloxyacyl hydrolase [Chitinophagaceae bacterium]|nr:acyloxyacyl hydrolase [Chitinophagaceae bacterium]